MRRSLDMAKCESWLVTGAAGQLGGYILARLSVRAAAGSSAPNLLALLRPGGGRLEARGANVRTIEVNLADGPAVAELVRREEPTHVIHAGGVTAVGDAFRDPNRAMAVNRDGTAALAAAVQACGGRLVYVSTDMVFDGEHAPYRENSPANPLSAYGRSKLAGEQAAMAFGGTVVRLPLMYGVPRSERPGTFVSQIRALLAGEQLTLFVDEFRTPIWLPDAAAAVVAIARAGPPGVMHVTGPDRLSRYQMLERCSRFLGVDEPRLVGVSRLSIDAPEPRPADLSLVGEQFRSMFPDLTPRALGPDCLTAFRPPA